MNRKISFAEGEYYHVYNRGIEKRDIFLSNDDRRRFQELLFLCNSQNPVNFREIKQKNQGLTFVSIQRSDLGEPIVAIGAYCLMPNHAHILLKEIRENGITDFMRKLMTAYVMYFNRKYDRQGALFQGKFKAEHADHDEYLKYLFGYIHLNPVKLIDRNWKEDGIHDLSEAEQYITEYPYSSYRDYVEHDRMERVILSPEDFPEYFTAPTDFIDYHKDWLKYRSKI